jgi:DNA repair exonuclease SbcCD ATPase subunit
LEFHLKKGILFGAFLSIITLPSKAEFTDSCGLYAQMLWNSASSYSNAKSTYEMEKSNYESACNSSYGYSKNDSSACGNYGYVLTAYNDSVDQVNTTKEEFDSALNNVATFCGIPDSFYQLYNKQGNQLKSTISELEKRIKTLETENKSLRKSLKK